MSKNLRILHAPINSAGQAYLISRAQRKLGFKSDVIVFYETVLDYQSDKNLHLDKMPILIRELVMLWTFLGCLFRYDVFHFHCGLSFLPYYLDVPILKLFGKTVIMEYWGSDCIQTDIKGGLYRQLSPETLKEIFPKLDNNERRQKIKKITGLADAVVVGGYSLEPYVPQSITIEKAIDLEKFPFVGVSQTTKPVIAHAPTNQKIKGTAIIVEAIEKLKADGFDFEFVLIENKPNKEAREMFEKADIIIDQILVGDYGTFATETMAIGKPVVCWIEDDFAQKYYSDCPIVRADAKNIYQKLKELIEKPEWREELSRLGSEYAKRRHDSSVIAKEFIELYGKVSSK